jgi:hypothetical protein
MPLPLAPAAPAAAPADAPPAAPPAPPTGWRFRRALLHGALAGGLAAAGSLALPDQFRSVVRILSDTGRAGQGASFRTGVWAPAAAPETPGSRDDGPTVIYVDILRSRRLAERILLQEHEYDCRSWRFGRAAHRRGTLLDYLGAGSVDEALGALKGVLGIQRDLKSGLLTLHAETRSPGLSLQVVQGAREALRDFLTEMSQEAGRDRARFILERLGEVQGRYRASARAFQDFQEANRNWSASPSPNVRFRGGELKADVDLWGQVAANLTLGHEQALLEARNDLQSLLVLDPGSLPLRKSGPHRAFIAFASALVAGTFSWAHLNRALIRNRLLAKERP